MAFAIFDAKSIQLECKWSHDKNSGLKPKLQKRFMVSPVRGSIWDWTHNEGLLIAGAMLRTRRYRMSPTRG